MHDPLFARAAAFRTGGVAAILIVLDVLCVSRDWSEKFKGAISKEIGLPKENVLVAATHTHSGPAVFFPAAGEAGPIDRCEDALLGRCAEAVRKAYATAEPARMRAARISSEGIAANRRDPSCPTDSALSVVRVEGRRGAVKGHLVSLSCHPTVMGPSNLRYSADLFGVAASRTEKRFRNSVCMMFNGTSADASTRFVRANQTWAELDRLGRKLAGQILAASRSSEPVAAGPISGKTVAITFPFRKVPDTERAQKEYDEALRKARVDPEGAASARLHRSLVEGAAARLLLSRIGGWQPLFGTSAAEVELQVIRIGDIIVCGLPGEFFARIGRELRKAALPKFGLIAGYAGGYWGYFVPPKEAQRGGYEAAVAPLEPESEPEIVRAALTLIREIKKSRRSREETSNV